MHSNRMRTARSLMYRGVSLDRDPPAGQRPPPLDRDTPLLDRHPTDRNLPWTETPAVNRITDKCKNITFPQLRLRAVKTVRLNSLSSFTLTVSTWTMMVREHMVLLQPSKSMKSLPLTMTVTRMSINEY